jgi:hypothetical protein
LAFIYSQWYIAVIGCGTIIIYARLNYDIGFAEGLYVGESDASQRWHNSIKNKLGMVPDINSSYSEEGERDS